jgi:hypothetical protein
MLRSNVCFIKLCRSACFVFTFLFFLCVNGYSLNHSNSSSPASESVKPFLGRWDLTLKAPDREYPSWLELSQVDGKLEAQFVGRWGNARPLPKAEISAGVLTFVSPKEEEASKDDMVFQGRLGGGRQL